MAAMACTARLCQEPTAWPLAIYSEKTVISFLVQGAGFNIEFFAHANRETLALAAVALQPVLLVVLAYLLLVLACPFLMPKASARSRSPTLVAATAVAGLALNAPAWSFGWHAATVVNDVQNAL